MPPGLPALVQYGSTTMRTAVEWPLLGWGHVPGFGETALAVVGVWVYVGPAGKPV